VTGTVRASGHRFVPHESRWVPDRFLLFPDAPSSAIDPCVGDGAAFEVITTGAKVFRYGIELDAYWAQEARQRIPNIVQGSTLEVQCAVECFGLSYLNPPYDFTLGPGDSRRTEQMFLGHTYRWLKPAGILVLVIPSERLAECSQILASQFRDARVYRLETPECVRYKQVVVIGARRSRREKERLTDGDITRARLYYATLAGNSSQIPVLPSEPEARYQVPGSGKSHLAQAIGHAVIQQGYRVFYRETHGLLEEIADATLDGTRKECLESLTTVPLLIIDDFGMRKLPLTAAEELLELIMRRYERASTLVTSNRPVEDWGKLLGDAAAVSAMLDRLLHHGHLLKCGPRSWRTKTDLPAEPAAG